MESNEKGKNGNVSTEVHEMQEVVEEDPYLTSCGIGSFRPGFLSAFGNITTFTIVYSGFALVTQILSSYVGSQIPTLEKQFGLSSYQTGVLMSCNDIGFLICIILISSWARLVNIPRSLFLCVLLFGSSGILCSLPYFISSSTGNLPVVEEGTSANTSSITKKTKMVDIPLCTFHSDNNSIVESECISGKDGSAGIGVTDSSVQLTALVLIGGGMFLQGVAKAPRGPFVTVYVDDSVERRKTAFYIGIMTGFAIFGPALAYAIGALFSRMYVTLEDVDMSPRDPRWIGAWWLGFIVFGIAAFVIATPIVCFPRRLKWTGKEHKRPPRPQINLNVKLMSVVVIKERLLSYWRILTLPMYLIITSINLCQLISLAGFFSFLPKYIQTQYGVPVWKANLILAGTNIASLSLGTFVGGFITRRFKMTPRKCYSILLALFLIHTTTFACGYFLGCDQPVVVGPDSTGRGLTALQSNCSTSCDCDHKDFFPICGSDGVNYYSPCYAGCSETLRSGRTYSNCTCIPDGEATAGLCESGCYANLHGWIGVNFISFFFSSMKIMVSFTAKIRCVEDRDKSTAAGLNSFLMSLLAWMPIPIIFGQIVDTTCLIWKTSCSSRGACLHYDIVDYRWKHHTFGLVFKLMATLICCIGLRKVWNWSDWPQNKQVAGAANKDNKDLLVKNDEKVNGVKD